MNENRHDLREGVFGATLEPERVEGAGAPLEQLQGDATVASRDLPQSRHEPLTIPYTELPPPQPDSQLYKEWNFYRREAGRLLAEGQEGRFVLIKGEDLIGIWSTREEAEAVALEKYLMQPCLIQQVRSREPVVRMSARFWRWPS